MFRNNRLELRTDDAPTAEWNYPAPVGRQTVVTEFTTVAGVMLSRHVKFGSLAEVMTLAPLKDLGDEDHSHPQPVDAQGRSAQTFLVEAIGQRGSEQRRSVIAGQDIYAVTAPLLVETLRRVLKQPGKWRGVIAAGELGDAREFLQAVAARHSGLTLT